MADMLKRIVPLDGIAYLVTFERGDEEATAATVHPWTDADTAANDAANGDRWWGLVNRAWALDAGEDAITPREIAEVALRPIPDRDAAERFLWLLAQGIGGGFHPDERGAGYVHADGSPMFTAGEAGAIDAALEQACGLVPDQYEAVFAAWRAADMMPPEGV